MIFFGWKLVLKKVIELWTATFSKVNE